MNSVIPQTRLDQIANIELSNVDKKTNEKEINVVLCNYVDVYKHWAITKAHKKDFMIATAKKSEIKKFSLKKGQVAITKDSEKRDDIGISAYIADTLQDVVLGYHCALITPNPELLDGSYLNAFFHTNMAKKHFENQASGSGQRYTLTKEGISCIKIPLPKLEYQKTIGRILSSLDRKIFSNNSIISKLEEMAKTIYKYWFLQFDFPNSEGKPYASSGGTMKYSEELGKEIPIDWEILNLWERFEFDKGIEIGAKQYLNESSKNRVLFWRVGDMNGTCSTYADEKLFGKLLLQPRDICVSFDGSVGKVDFGLVGGYSSGIRKIYDRLKKIDGSVIYQIFKSDYIQQLIHKYATGSNILHASGSITNMRIPYNEKVCEEYQKIIKPMFDKMVQTKQENQKLAQLRDWLLPMLMNGQARVE